MRSQITASKSFHLSLVAVMLIVFSFGGCSQKDKPQISRRCFPVPIKIDDEKLLSTIYFELDFIEYNTPFAEFASNASTQEEKFIRDALTMIATGDTDKATELIVADSIISRDSWFSAAPEQYISMLGKNFERLGISDDLSNTTIGSCFYWRNLGIVTFAADKFDIDKIGTLIYERQDDNFFLTMAWPNLSSLVREIATQTHNNSSLCSSREDIDFDYAFTFHQQHPQHQATLLFKGKQYDVVIPGDKIKSDDKPAYFYQQFISDIKKISTPEDIPALADYFDEYGRKKFLGWCDKKNENTFSFLDEIAQRDIRINFIIDAGPVYLIYITPSRCAMTIEGHDYILKKEDGLKIARLAYGDNLSEIMGGKDFRESFLNSLSNND